MDEEGIVKLIAGDLPEDKQVELLNEILSDQELMREYSRLMNAWVLMGTSKLLSFRSISENFRDVKRKVRTTESMWNRMVRFGRRYAAIIIIALVVGAGWFVIKSDNPLQNKTCLVSVPYGQSATITLADGSKVWLNSGSRLEYPALFGKKNRKLTLSGEAYFDVESNSNVPFLVDVAGILVKVTGTEFNIMAYPGDNNVHTTLVEGSVSLVSPKGKEFLKLNAGEQADFNRQKKQITRKRINTDLYTSWKEGIITLNGVTLGEMAKYLERWYNVEIRIENSELLNQKFTGAILRDKQISEVLEVIKLTSGIESYNIEASANKRSIITIK
jgi:ferric-dicitrate binding protein FerR (iron transport regulator)